MKYRIKRIDSIALDHIDEAWEKAEKGVLLSNADATKADIYTEFRLAYTGDGDIYFLFNMDDEHPNVTMAGYNNPIYDEETVEFFMATENNHRDYLELEWNVLGGVFCANIDNDLEGHTKINFVENNPIVSNVIKRDGGYYIVGKIDKSAFKGKTEGSWLFNAYRIKRREDNSMKLYAYSPTFEEAFHRPKFFKELEFVRE